MAAATGTATIVFTDLAGSTGLRVEIGEVEADELRRRHDAVLGEVVASRNGRVVKGSGDGIVAAFDAASDAVAAAVAIQQAVEDLGRRRGRVLAVRIGISAGDISWEEGDCFGLPVVEAARLEAAAQPGQILCSEVVRILARGRSGAAFGPVGELSLKGLADPVVAFEVAWEPAVRASAELLTPLVGRRGELKALKDRWRAAAAGEGGLVLLAGDAGLGKSRLLAEFAGWVGDAGGRVWAGSCYEADTRAYGVIAEALERCLPALNPAEVADLLGPQASLLARIVPTVADVLPGLEEPPSVPAEDERARLHDAVSLVVDRAARQQPLLVVLDDCHWADAASVELAALLSRRAARSRSLLVLAYRESDLDERHPLAVALPSMRRDQATMRIGLEGLDIGAVRELVGDLAQRELPSHVTATLARQTGRNPFFVREVILHLLEMGRWATTAAGRSRSISWAFPRGCVT